MKKPIDKMKYIPFGHDYMIDAWIGLVTYAYNDKRHRKQFKKETNIDITDVAEAKGIKAMIDQKTGYQEDAIIKWADWVTVNLWGAEK